jgi:hypothetical protein
MYNPTKATVARCFIVIFADVLRNETRKSSQAGDNTPPLKLTSRRHAPSRFSLETPQKIYSLNFSPRGDIRRADFSRRVAASLRYANFLKENFRPQNSGAFQKKTAKISARLKIRQLYVFAARSRNAPKNPRDNRGDLAADRAARR